MATEVSGYDRDDQPYSNIGLIRVTFPDGTQAKGTCSLVGQNDIITATHVVYSPDNGGWADSYNFYFGADYNDLTNQFEDYGFEYSPSHWIVAGWPDQAFTDNENDTMMLSEIQYDTALIGIPDAIGNTLGWLGMSSGYNGTYLTEAVGYPVDTTGMMHEYVYTDKNPYYEIYESDYDVMGAGSSGGPLLIGDYVIGVKSTGSHWSDIGLVYSQLIEEIKDNNSLLSGSATPFDDYAADTSTTGLIYVGGQVSGEIEQADDQDWFAVYLEAELDYLIDQKGSDTGAGTLDNPNIEGIYDFSGKSISGTSNKDGGIGNNSRVSFTPANSDYYYISANGYGNASGTYTLSVVNDDYVNDTTTMGAVTVNGQTTGNIEQADDQDWFAVSLIVGEIYQIDLEGSATSAGTLNDPYLRGIYSSSGKLLSETTDDDSGYELNSQIEFSPTSSGTYYISADGYGSGSYLISVDTITPVNSAPTQKSEVNFTPEEGTFAYFLLEISNPMQVDASVEFLTRDGSAKAGSDYVATSGTATISAGDTYTTIQGC